MSNDLSKLLDWIDVAKQLPNEADIIEVKGKFKNPDNTDNMVIGRMTFKNNRFIDERTNIDWTDKIEYWRYGLSTIHKQF